MCFSSSFLPVCRPGGDRAHPVHLGHHRAPKGVELTGRNLDCASGKLQKQAIKESLTTPAVP
jgi:hypothetical protein